MMKSKRNHLEAWLVGTSLLACVGIALVHCGGTTCGDGKKEGSEQCDIGTQNGVANSGCSATCTIAEVNVAALQIFVTRLNNESAGYMGATCTDLKAASMHVVLTGPDAASSFDKTWDCSMNSELLPSVTAGDYSATITLLDGSGMAITNAVTGTATAAVGQQVTLLVNFAMKDFIKQDYTGTLYFSPSWGESMTSCTVASPPVTGYGVTLKDSTGTLVAGMSTGNRKLDGTSAPCFVPMSNGTAEGVAGIPWGHYDLAFTGYGGTELEYCKHFDVFNGPSADNMTYTDLVVTETGTDAGSCD